MKAQAEPIHELRLAGITKRFPGILACNNVSMQVARGEVLAQPRLVSLAPVGGTRYASVVSSVDALLKNIDVASYLLA